MKIRLRRRDASNNNRIRPHRVGDRIFRGLNGFFLLLLAFVCLYPFINVASISLSSDYAVAKGSVYFLPKDLTVQAYDYIFKSPFFLKALGITTFRVVVGSVTNMFFIILLAYPLSRPNSEFRFRTVYAWFFVFTTLFSGGLVPYYQLIKDVGLIDSIWVMIIPGLVPVSSVILLLNFMRGIPHGIEEAARIDGAGHMVVLWRILVPMSMPALATLSVFTILGHWNAWFDAYIFINNPDLQPLQTLLQNLMRTDFVQKVMEQMVAGGAGSARIVINQRTVIAAYTVITAVPILVVYPFFQRFFVKGIVVGSVKG